MAIVIKDRDGAMSPLQVFLNSPVPEVARCNTKAGDLFGVEIELEGRNVSHFDEGNPAGWTYHRDGSLRDRHGDSGEWVFSSPANLATSKKRLTELYKRLEKNRAGIVCSNRTSCHVHFNMSDKNAYQVVNTFILFTILEDILDRYCGEDRRGNLFCLNTRSAEAQLAAMNYSVFKNFTFVNMGDAQRYCSLNLASLNKFGSVEFRAMRGLDNAEDVIRWLSIIDDFTQYSCYKLTNPVKLIEDISVNTPDGLLREIFSPGNYLALTAGLTREEVSNSIYEGLRLVQIMCYRIGTEFDRVKYNGKDFWAGFNNEVKDDEEAPVEEEVGRQRAVPFRRLRREP